MMGPQSLLSGEHPKFQVRLSRWAKSQGLKPELIAQFVSFLLLGQNTGRSENLWRKGLLWPMVWEVQALAQVWACIEEHHGGNTWQNKLPTSQGAKS